MDFKWIINEGVLPFEYKVVPLDDVREVVSTHSGSGMIEMDSKDWLKTQYDADFEAGLVQYDAGTVKAVGRGTVAITATNSDGALSATATVNVVVAPEEISLEKKNRTIYMDDVLQLQYIITPEDTDYTEVIFSSSNTGIVKVDENGVLIPVSAGKATVTVSSVYDEKISAKCTITVKDGANPNPTQPPAQAYKLGDVDGNELIDAADALEVLKSAAKLITMDDSVVLAADVNKDNTINASDALDILKVAAKLMEFNE